MTENNPPKLIVYSAQWCGDCQKLKAFLNEENIEYENRDIVQDKKWGEELESKTGKLGVPYLLIGEEWVIGYEPGVGFSDSWARKTLKNYL